MTATGGDGREARRLLERAEEFLDAARDSLARGRYNVAFEEARTAAELGCKALLVMATGDYPRSHNVVPALHHARLTPKGLDAKALGAFLGASNRGVYGFDEPVGEEEARQGVAMAAQVLAELRRHRL